MARSIGSIFARMLKRDAETSITLHIHIQCDPILGRFAALAPTVKK